MNVKLIYSKNLSDKTGASTVMRLLKQSKSEFENRNVTLDVFSREAFAIQPQETSVNKNGRKKFSFKNKIVDILASVARNHPIAAYLLAYIQSMRAAKKIVSFCHNKIEPNDILFFHELYTAYYYLKNYGKTNPIVIVFHNDGRDFKLLEDRYLNFRGSYFEKELNKMNDMVLLKSDYVGFVSESSMISFRFLHREIDHRKLFYAHNGLSSKPFVKRAQGYPMDIVCVGTLIESKGQIFIVEALNKIKLKRGELPDIHFSIVGGGPLLEVLISKVNMYGLNKIITFYGPTDNVEKYLEKANIFILPSTSEGLPMAILEAMSMSLPIVSTPVGGIPETIIDKKTGLLIEPSVEGVISFIEDIEKYDWNKMAYASHEHFINNFSMSNMVDAYSKVFKSIEHLSYES